MSDQKRERAVSTHRQKQQRYDLQERLIEFAAIILEVVEVLPNSRAANHIAGQLVRCGTSPAANYGEAQSADSKKDFIHKMKVCLKELRETAVWLAIIQRKSLARSQQIVSRAAAECNELTAIFVSSVATAEGKRSK